MSWNICWEENLHIHNYTVIVCIRAYINSHIHLGKEEEGEKRKKLKCINFCLYSSHNI